VSQEKNKSSISENVSMISVKDVGIDYDTFLRKLPDCFSLGEERYEYFIKNDSELVPFVIDKFLSKGYDVLYSGVSCTFFLRKEVIH